LSTSTGLCGEFIAASSLISLGYRVALASQDAVDLVCWHVDDGQILRVQVKSATLKYQKGRSPVYHFNLASGARKKYLPKVTDYDLCVCVGIDHRRCLFYATEQIQQYSKRISPNRFDKTQEEYDTLQKALQIIKARK